VPGGREFTVLLVKMPLIEKYFACLWELSELVSLYMLVSICVCITRFVGQSMHKQRDRGMIF
jgi:hypothetical protein